MKDVCDLCLVQAHLPEILDMTGCHVLEAHWKVLRTLCVARGLSSVCRSAVASISTYGSRWLWVLLEVLLDRIGAEQLRLLHRQYLWLKLHILLHHVVLWFL